MIPGVHIQSCRGFQRKTLGRTCLTLHSTSDTAPFLIQPSAVIMLSPILLSSRCQGPCRSMLALGTVEAPVHGVLNELVLRRMPPWLS